MSIITPTFDIVVDCGSLSDPEDGTVEINGTVFGSQASYSCDIGYNLVGVNTRTCLDSQQWSDSAPHCQSMRIHERE